MSMKINDLVDSYPFVFDGNVGGLLDASELEESYAIIWVNPTPNLILELPTGGAAIMSKGQNSMCFAKKEQCLAIAKQLRMNFKINNYRIVRTFPNGEAQFLHPKDGVSPEKVNEGRLSAGKQDSILGKSD